MLRRPLRLIGESEVLLHSDAGDGYGPHRLNRFSLRKMERNMLEARWGRAGSLDREGAHDPAVGRAAARECPWPHAKVEMVPFGRALLELRYAPPDPANDPGDQPGV